MPKSYDELVKKLYYEYIAKGYPPNAAKRVAYATANSIKTREEARKWQKKPARKALPKPKKSR